jgi:hypothetical protein
MHGTQALLLFLELDTLNIPTWRGINDCRLGFQRRRIRLGFELLRRSRTGRVLRLLNDMSELMRENHLAGPGRGLKHATLEVDVRPLGERHRTLTASATVSVAIGVEANVGQVSTEALLEFGLQIVRKPGPEGSACGGVSGRALELEHGFVYAAARGLG